VGRQAVCGSSGCAWVVRLCVVSDPALGPTVRSHGIAVRSYRSGDLAGSETRAEQSRAKTRAEQSPVRSQFTGGSPARFTRGSTPATVALLRSGRSKNSLVAS
jgi:hypothetical protein